MPIDPKKLATTAVQTFADEFNSLSLWNGVSGRWMTKYFFSPDYGSTLDSNGEQEMYINSMYAQTAAVKPWTVANGILTLTADKATDAIKPLINNYQYTSGLLNTYPSFKQTYGYFEIRAQLPKGQGLWPAFWLLPANGSWPPEIDVFEVLGNDPTTLYTTAHTNSTGTHTYAGTNIKVPDTSLGFHTYGVDWGSDYIVFYFDRAEVFRTPTPSDLNQPMYLIIDFAVGGFWPGMADATTPFPAKMLVDYVRAYKAFGAPVAPPPGPAYVPPPVPAPSGGIILTGDDAITMQPLVGSAGNDVFYAGRRGSLMTGNGGANVYAWKALPWTASRITDFKLGTDGLDFSQLSATPEVQTSFKSDGADGVTVEFLDPSFAYPYGMVTLEHVALTNVTVTKLLAAPVVASAFGAALTAFVDQYASTSASEKITQLKAQITRLGG